jgi:hypothetical protein
LQSNKLKGLSDHVGNNGILFLSELHFFNRLNFLMKLMSKELRKKIPPLYSQENVKDPIVYAKYFMPDSHWTWYVLEFDGKDTFFGYVDGDYQELGYFSLSELESIRGPLGLEVERDLYWKPKPLSEVKKK